jgi:hypothetical protein
MALPRLTIKLFDPKPGKSYLGAGNLIISIADVHAFAEWLLGQAGEYDDYLNENVVKLLAFEYSNTSRGGNTYRTVQLKDPADLADGPARQNRLSPAPASPLSASGNTDEGYDDSEVPF